MSNHTYNQHLVCTACGIREERGETKGYDNCPKYYTKAPTAPEPSEELRQKIESYNANWVIPGYSGLTIHMLPKRCVDDILALLAAALAKQDTQSTANVDRFEVIDETGRAYVRGGIYGSPVKVELNYQDCRRTLKIFVEPDEPAELEAERKNV